MSLFVNRLKLAENGSAIGNIKPIQCKVVYRLYLCFDHCWKQACFHSFISFFKTQVKHRIYTERWSDCYLLYSLRTMNARLQIFWMINLWRRQSSADLSRNRERDANANSSDAWTSNMHIHAPKRCNNGYYVAVCYFFVFVQLKLQTFTYV